VNFRITSILVSLALVLGIAGSAEPVTVWTSSTEASSDDTDGDGNYGGFSWCLTDPDDNVAWDGNSSGTVDLVSVSVWGGGGASPASVGLSVYGPYDSSPPALPLSGLLGSANNTVSGSTAGYKTWTFTEGAIELDVTKWYAYEMTFSGSDGLRTALNPWTGQPNAYEGDGRTLAQEKTVWYDWMPNGSIVTTPEPATVAILGLGSLVLLRRRRG